MRLAPLLLALALGACAGPAVPPRPETPPDSMSLAPARFADLPGWEADDLDGLGIALARSCARLARLADDAAPGGAPIAAWRAACAGLPTEGPGLKPYIESRFAPWQVTGRAGPDGLFTGYYEPELQGSRSCAPPFVTPLYAPPPDMVKVDLGRFRPDWKGEKLVGRVEKGQLLPLPDRARIMEGALAGQGLEILCVDDKVQAFFLEIQGSGRVRLEDGSMVRLGYAAQNGFPYFAIGRELIARGEIAREDMSLQAIAAWLEAHPGEADRVMALNRSAVFFAEQDKGPLGAQGVELTPGRSLAVDRSFLPLGAPLWLDVEDPRGPGARIRRLVVAQDTGGAIKGVVRGDLFWGFGPEAAQAAGRMKSAGRFWLLLPAGD